MSERMAWVRRASCGHIVDAWSDLEGTRSREDFITWLGPKDAQRGTIEHVPSVRVRHEGFCRCGDSA